MEVFIVVRKAYKEDIWAHNPQKPKEIIDEIISVRLTEDSAKEDVKTSTDDLKYIRKYVT